ncbi:MAG: hypothetical protein MUF72_14115 [Elainella sp. Prado103]|nr:hypothetical protein [Elainella sp. Prado103]
MKSLRTNLHCWALKHLPLLPHLRRNQQAQHLEKCWKVSSPWEPHQLR